MDYALAQERRDRLNGREIEAIEFHVEKSRVRSIREGQNAFAASSPEEYRENVFNSVLLSELYPDNIAQIVAKYESSQEHRLTQRGFDVTPF